MSSPSTGLEVNWRYRVAVLNDFRNTYAFIDFKKFGPVTHLEVCEVKGPMPERVASDDGIGIFVNWKRLVVVQDRASALYLLEDLIVKAPEGARKDFELYGDTLRRSLR